MKCYTFALIIFLFVGCAGSTSSEVEDKTNSNIIDLAASFENIRTVKLSEIADSVTFIPFETTSQSLMDQNQNGIRFSTSYIFYFDKYYDWNGKYGGTIVKRGQGPYEEVDGGYLLYKDNHFYSKGSKFIEYDITGKPTGKVRNLYASREFSGRDFLRKGTGFSSVGENFIIYDYPKVIYFFNKNFETVSSRELIRTDSSTNNLVYLGGYSDAVSYYKDMVIFYNGFNDTIFQIKATGLEPRWVVNFNHPSRYLLVIDEGKRRSWADELNRALRGQISFSNLESIKNSEGKHSVHAVYETESCVFFFMKELINFPEMRGLTPPDPYIVYHDKNSGKITRVKGKGFVDDLLGMDFFYPKLGIFNEKMITYIWPFELLNYIKECKEKGREVNPKLITLSKQVKEDDNPVLILFHLKK